MKTEKTNRGFEIIKFKDRNGEACSLQESSLATEHCIWLGSDEINLKTFKRGEGWTEYPDGRLLEKFNAESVLANTRMHLTRDQVKELLPHLIKFSEEGSL